MREQPIYRKVSKLFEDFVKDNKGFINALLIPGRAVIITLFELDDKLAIDHNGSNSVVTATPAILSGPYNVRHVVIVPYQHYRRVFFMDNDMACVYMVHDDE